MSFESGKISQEDKESFYHELSGMLDGLIGYEKDGLAQLCNAAALLGWQMEGINWVGFYLHKNNELVVGPFQGKPACTHIALSKGVCGAAASQKKTFVVDDVDAFPGHIACDAVSKSEVVIPLVKDGVLLGVLDIDSPSKAHFTAHDAKGLERIAEVLVNRIHWDQVLNQGR